MKVNSLTYVYFQAPHLQYRIPLIFLNRLELMKHVNWSFASEVLGVRGGKTIDAIYCEYVPNEIVCWRAIPATPRLYCQYRSWIDDSQN